MLEETAQATAWVASGRAPDGELVGPGDRRSRAAHGLPSPLERVPCPWDDGRHGGLVPDRSHMACCEQKQPKTQTVVGGAVS